MRSNYGSFINDVMQEGGEGQPFCDDKAKCKRPGSWNKERRERLNFLSRPKKCYFHSPLYGFCLIMTIKSMETTSQSLVNLSPERLAEGVEATEQGQSCVTSLTNGYYNVDEISVMDLRIMLCSFRCSAWWSIWRMPRGRGPQWSCRRGRTIVQCTV